jgi:hypothetical protein
VFRRSSGTEHCCTLPGMRWLRYDYAMVRDAVCSGLSLVTWCNEPRRPAARQRGIPMRRRRRSLRVEFLLDGAAWYMVTVLSGLQCGLPYRSQHPKPPRREHPEAKDLAIQVEKEPVGGLDA